MIERGEDVGGTWWSNSYPGCQCDIPSNLYSFSFAPNPDWDRAYPMRDQIFEYLRGCAERFGVRPHVRLNCELLDAHWVAGAQHWELETSTGPLAARVLVIAPGLLSEPFTPALPGLERFQGNAFHTAAWDHSDDLTGKRVALIGSGASAIQVVPEIQPIVERLHLFQRTPPWVIPHPDRAVTRGMRELYRRVPPVQKLPRAAVYAAVESMALGLKRDRRWARWQALNARLHLRRQVPDPELRALLTPDYEIFCKRILLSSRWYPAHPGAERGPGELRHPRAARALDRGRRRSRARDRHARARHRLQARRAADCRARPRPRGELARRASGAAAPRPTSARPSRGSRTSCSSTART